MLFGGLEMLFCGGWVENKFSLLKKEERGLLKTNMVTVQGVCIIGSVKLKSGC